MRNQFQEIAIGIEEVEAIMIPPVNRPLVPNPGLRKGRAGPLEIAAAHAKGMVSFAERLLDPTRVGRREVFPLEEGKGRTGKIQDDLIAEAAGHLQTQEASVERLGNGKVAYL
jgi:hypothetical protein